MARLIRGPRPRCRRPRFPGAPRRRRHPRDRRFCV